MRGVSAAGAGAMIPLMKQTAVMPFTLREVDSGRKPTHGRALVYWITLGYAESLGLRLREGRFFVESDARSGALATIVNQEFVRRHLPARQATGLMLPGLVNGDRGVTAEIVGVVGNMLKDGNDRQPQPELYFIHGSHGQRMEQQGVDRGKEPRYRHVMDYREPNTVEPDKRGGKPCIRGLRITVYDVLEYLASGMTEDEILADFPDLTREDIRAVLLFAADRERRLASTAV